MSDGDMPRFVRRNSGGMPPPLPPAMRRAGGGATGGGGGGGSRSETVEISLDEFLEEKGMDVDVQPIPAPPPPPEVTSRHKIREALGLHASVSDDVVLQAIMQLRQNASKNAAVAKNLVGALSHIV